jgi:hypothetical protein
MALFLRMSLELLADRESKFSSYYSFEEQMASVNEVFSDDVAWLTDNGFVVENVFSGEEAPWILYVADTNFDGQLSMKLFWDTKEIEAELVLKDIPIYKHTYKSTSAYADLFREQPERDDLDIMMQRMEVSQKSTEEAIQKIVGKDIDVTGPFSVAISDGEFEFSDEYRLTLTAKRSKPAKEVYNELADAVKALKEWENPRRSGHDFLAAIIHHSGVALVPNGVDIEECVYDACIAYMNDYGTIICDRPYEEQMTIYEDDGKKCIGNYFVFWMARGFGGSYYFTGEGTRLDTSFKEIYEYMYEEHISEEEIELAKAVGKYFAKIVKDKSEALVQE